MSRERGDYTAWHKAQADAPSIREYSKRAMDYQREQSGHSNRRLID